MKDDHNHNHNHIDHRYHPSTNFYHRRPHLWIQTINCVRPYRKTVSYILIILLTYALGYFHASSTPSKIETTVTPLTPVTPLTTVKTTSTITDLTTLTNCPTANNDYIKFNQPCGKPVQPELIRSMIIDRIFEGISPYENFPPEHVAHLLEPKKVKGWGSYGAVFETLIIKTRPKTIIEIGTFLGASATHMAELAEKLGLETQILCVDDFRGWPGFTEANYVPTVNGDVLLLHQFMQNVVSLNRTGSIIPVPFSTGSGLGKLCEWGVLADLIEVDAGHDFHSAWSDINLGYKLLKKPGGVMFGHDYFNGNDNKGVRRAVDLFARVHGFKVTTQGQHWILIDH
ncbi:uncharacterized protein LOC141658527 [Silene latifolia]|uniref:uncharacterized protein LOC141658527 n=1 Tax=Silene latifolia TaxID=37657 RepID=UPI003D77208D